MLSGFYGSLLNWKHLTMAAIGGSAQYIAAFIGFTFTGVADLVWVVAALPGGVAEELLSGSAQC